MADGTSSILLFFRKTLGGIRELEHFPTSEQRERAIDKLLLRPLSWPELILIGLIAVLLIPRLGGILLSRQVERLLDASLPFDVPSWIATLGFYITTLGVAFVLLWWLHRHMLARRVRHMLLNIGIPVCESCGHNLRGQSPDSQRCTECGAKLGYWIQRTLARLHASRDQNGASDSNEHS